MWLRSVAMTTALLLICVATTEAHWGRGWWGRGRGNRDSKKLINLACETTTIDGVTTTRECGCGDEPKVPCDIGPLALPQYNITAAMYCNVPPYRGVLSASCLVQGALETNTTVFRRVDCKPHPDGTHVSCDMGPVTVFIEGVQSNAFFCNRVTEHPIRSRRSDSCIRLTSCSYDETETGPSNPSPRRGRGGRRRGRWWRG